MSFDPTKDVSVFPPRAVEIDPGFVRYLPLPTPQKLREQYLFGIPLTSSLTQETLSDDTIKEIIIKSISQVEHELKIFINPVVLTERRDYYYVDYLRFCFMQLYNWPIIKIISFSAMFPNETRVTQFPTEWIVPYNETGLLKIAPTTGTLSNLLISGSGSYVPLILWSKPDWPQFFEICFECGYELDKLPATIADLVGYAAAIKVLGLLTATLFPYGAYSVSLDGINQSVTSPGVQFLEGRIADAKEQYGKLMQVAKNYYNKSFVYGVL
jgi:hypothetical protein